MFIVRVVSGDLQRSSVRDTPFVSKREALTAIARLGALSSIRKAREPGASVYIVTAKK